MNGPLGDLGAIQLFAFLERPFALTVSGLELLVQGALPFLKALLFGGHNGCVEKERGRVAPPFLLSPVWGMKSR